VGIAQGCKVMKARPDRFDFLAYFPNRMIHIAYNIDGNYVRFCGVTTLSILENNRNESLCFHVVGRGLTDEHRRLLTELVERYHQQIRFYEPDARLLEGFAVQKFSRRISLATYYRCFLSEILPTEVDRVLYLDCDILVLQSLAPLAEIPMDQVAVAAVEDIGCHEAERYEILQYPAEHSYFNAGVLLLNLAYWREHHIAKACMDYYHAHADRLLYNDQDLLNSVLHDCKATLPLRWNVQDGFYRRHVASPIAQEPGFQETLAHPAILHFTNRKPWNYESQHPLRHLYYDYEAASPWAAEGRQGACLRRLKRFFRLLPFYLHLRKAKYIQA
jgi:lipopolysaccharide biosynthesis glycosyltransferase